MYDNKHFQMEDQISDKDIEKQKAEANRLSIMFKETFTTPMGKDCLSYLEQHFIHNRNLINPNYPDMYNNMELGKRDLILFIKQQIAKEV
jgi:hypothetical protein